MYKKLIKKINNLFNKPSPVSELWNTKINYEELFNELIENNLQDISIKYSERKNEFKNLNQFYNDFFNKYEIIKIGKHDEIIIQYNYTDFRSSTIEHPKSSILIGIYYDRYLYVKENSIKNGVYEEILDFLDENSLESEDPTYENIYQIMVDKISQNN